MSVIVRKLDDEDKRYMLLSKGADNVIFERLKKGNDELKAVTEDHLSEFASNGLRTLTLAWRFIAGTFGSSILSFTVLICYLQTTNTTTGAQNMPKLP